MKPERSPERRDLDWQALIETALTAPGPPQRLVQPVLPVQLHEPDTLTHAGRPGAGRDL